MCSAYVRLTFVAANDSLIHVRRMEDNGNLFVAAFAAVLTAAASINLHFTDRRSILYAVCSFTILYLVKMGFRIVGGFLTIFDALAAPLPTLINFLIPIFISGFVSNADFCDDGVKLFFEIIFRRVGVDVSASGSCNRCVHPSIDCRNDDSLYARSFDVKSVDAVSACKR